MNNRIKKLRKELDLTQREFAERIGVKQNTIAQYEIGRNTPIDTVISLICREFNVNENWLRYGTEPMFIETSHNRQIEEFIENTLKGEPDSFRRRLISALASMNDTGWNALEKLIDSIQINTTVTTNEPDIDEMVEDYRRQLELEKKAEEKSEASRKSV